MRTLAKIAFVAAALLTVYACKKKDEPTDTTNIASQVVANLSVISQSYAPTSLQSVSTSSVAAQSDPCAGVSDFAVCQSILIREYLKIAKSTVDTLSTLAGGIGSALGQVPDGNSGTSGDGKISWNKTNSDVWSILTRGAAAQTLAYFSVNSGTYTLKLNQNVNEDTPADQMIEAIVTFNTSDDWEVDVFFSNGVCDATDVTAPSKAHIKISKAAGLWTGKAMLYAPRWKAPGATSPTCSTIPGIDDVAMYTDFVGNDTSTKAALLILPSTENLVNNITSANYGLPQFCTHWPNSCDGGAGELPNATALNVYPNNWCTTGAGTNPTWGDDCTSNTAVSAASYSAPANWTTPAILKTKTVSMPSSL